MTIRTNAIVMYELTNGLTLLSESIHDEDGQGGVSVMLINPHIVHVERDKVTNVGRVGLTSYLLRQLVLNPNQIVAFSPDDSLPPSLLNAYHTSVAGGAAEYVRTAGCH